ncbi:hypothetical protein N9E48_00775 [Paracoccaceae bacterium]|nr:hypothetical protein [Paracoccaceae bacterium]
MNFTVHYAPDNTLMIVQLALLEFERLFSTKLVDQPNQRQGSDTDVIMNPNGLITVIETPDSNNY